jgi:choline dehydrogenase
MYESEPEPELGGQIIYQPAGKLLGGTSSINGMVYMRGHPADYDGWHQLGCAGWNWESVLPYFRRAEDQERGADEFHGADGPLCVSEPRMRWELADRWTIAAIEAGLPLNHDFNGARQEGAGHFQNTIRHGRRWSAADAYLRPAQRRRNLTIETNAPVIRILIENGGAVGVTFVNRGTQCTVRVRRDRFWWCVQLPPAAAIVRVGIAKAIAKVRYTGNSRDARGRISKTVSVPGFRSAAQPVQVGAASGQRSLRRSLCSE